MRRVASAVLIAAVGAVAIAAAVDAVEQAADTEARASARSLRLYYPDARTVLRGRLVWIDHRCRLHVTDISTLRRLERPRRVSCGAGLDARGRLTPRRDDRVSPNEEEAPIGLPLSEPKVIIFSPDERWAIAGGRRSLFLFRPGDSARRFRRLPIAAADVAWVSSSA